MRTSPFILILMISFSVSLIAQAPVIPKTGEGRFNRSSNTVLWPNTLFTQPSVFFSVKEIDARAQRKWWRVSANPIQPLSAPLSLDPLGVKEKGGWSLQEIPASKNSGNNNRGYFFADQEKFSERPPVSGSGKYKLVRTEDYCMLTKEILKSLPIPGE